MTPRLVWLLWDAGAARLAERFLAEGILPNLARLAARGLRAGARPAWPCAQTPPGMATLLTGAPTHVHQVYGYREAARPRSARTALETETGFNARRLRAETLWEAAARAGRSAAVAFAPLANPHMGDARILSFDGYGSVLAGQAVHRSGDLPRAGDVFELVLPIAEKPSALSLRASDFTPGEPLRLLLGGTAGVTLVLLERDGEHFTFWRSGVWRITSSVPGAAEELLRAAGPFVGSGAGNMYREGLLGTSCRAGGDGRAEARCLETIAASSRFFTRASAHVLSKHPSDVTVLYEPCIDEAAHIFQDLVERDDPCALGVLRGAYRLADEHLGVVLHLAGDDAIVAVGSDHGQQGVKRVFRPNVVLHEAGLLAVDEGGHIDLDRTKALYGPAGNGFLLVNSKPSPRGVVSEQDTALVAREAAMVLLARRDERGEPFLLAALEPGQRTADGEVPGREAGDLYLMAAPGVSLGTGAVGAVGDVGTGGQHTASLDVVELDALFVVGGPSVPRRGRLETRIDNRDVAPTLARLVGVPAPAQATGKAIVD